MSDSPPKRPVIGITIDNVDGQDRYMSPYTYAGAVERAGGLPLLLPYRVDLALVPQYVDQLDGLLLSGGNDLNPNRYGTDPYHPKTSPIDPPREAFELALLAEVERRRMPVLGVCLGSQVMNVHRGGSLHQYLPELERDGPLEHRFLDGVRTRHDVIVDTATQLGGALGSARVSVNTYHKQAVKELGRGLRVIATAPDGVIEAFEDPTYPLFAAVQWHPERLADEPEHLAPFQLLVRRAAKT